jgi:hypothetical protein
MTPGVKQADQLRATPRAHLPFRSPEFGALSSPVWLQCQSGVVALSVGQGLGSVIGTDTDLATDSRYVGLSSVSAPAGLCFQAPIKSGHSADRHGKRSASRATSDTVVPARCSVVMPCAIAVGRTLV